MGKDVGAVAVVPREREIAVQGGYRQVPGIVMQAGRRAAVAI